MYRLMDTRASEEVTIALIISVLTVLLIFSFIYVFSPGFFSKISLLEPIQSLVLNISEFFGYVAINYYQLIWIYIPLGIIGLWLLASRTLLVMGAQVRQQHAHNVGKRRKGQRVSTPGCPRACGEETHLANRTDRGIRTSARRSGHGSSDLECTGCQPLFVLLPL